VQWKAESTNLDREGIYELKCLTESTRSRNKIYKLIGQS